MKRLLLLDILLYGILFNSTWAWSVYMPSNIYGLHKSCLVIPCTFSYSYYPPRNPYRIVWYQYVDRGYPLVFDSWNPYSVIERYRGRTSLYKGTYGDCSLLIKDLRFSHDGDRIYAWIDPENVGWRTFKFYDVSTFIHVRSSAPKPDVDISGGYKIGERIRVRCITYHTCPYNSPSLSLSGIQKTSDSLEDNYIGGGKWKIMLTRHGVVESERQRVECSVRHSGGLSASTTKIHNAECFINQAQITPDSNTEFLEGVEQDIVCSVTYMCSSAQPQISWKNGIFNGINTYISKQGIKYEARSTLKYTATANDHGKTITCQTEFKGTVQRVQITLRVKRSMGSLDWSFTMPSAINGIQGSCVVIPCSYKFKTSEHTGAEVKWYSKTPTTSALIYDQSSHSIIPKFEGKTSLYGSLNENNCSLKIQPLDMSHNRERLFPWMDQNPPDTYHRKNVEEETIALEVTATVEKPQAEILGRATVGEPMTLSCSVIHTCPPIPPTLSFSISRGSSRFIHTPLYHGKWKATKEITWTVEENDNSVTCSVSYAGGQKSKTEITLNPLCPIDQAQITPDSNTEFLEGVEQDIVCFVTYMCSKDRPYIIWSGEQLPGSTFHVTKHGLKQIAKSTLKFTPKASDNDKTITCLADFKGNVQRVEVTLRVQRSMGSLDWSFTMPSTITGVRGSCVVIPCNYEFKNVQPSRTNVKWYKLSTAGYSLVYDQSTHNIINQFKGKTSLYGSSNDKNCSLKIQPLEMQHSQEKLFPWMDPNSIESYHSKNFDHVTIVLEITDIVEKPEADLLGIAKVGKPVTLSCSVLHTCPSTPPSLSLSISHVNQQLIHTPLHDGKWRSTVEITWTVEENDKSVTCTVSYAGGQTSKTDITINPLCDFHKPVISPTQDEVMEGIEKSFTCTVTHTCQKQKPNIIWNYQNMPVSAETHKVDSHIWRTVSTLKLKASWHDHGKTLRCTIQTTEGETSDHVTVKVKRGMFSLDWTYSMPSKMTGLRGTCLVIPCSFDFKNSTKNPADVEVKWYLYSTSQYPLVYSPDGKNVIDKYSGKTRLYGLTSEKNCSLEIKTEMNHNGDRLYPWMDPKSIETFHKEDFYAKSIELQITEQADKPKLSIIGVPRVGEQVTVSCSVFHTCLSNPPSLSVGKALETDISVHNPMQDFWELTRIHTFIIKEEEQTITCKATFHGGQISESQIDLNAQCTYKDITIDPEVADVVEGVANNFTCTVFHSCKSKPPNFNWNYKDIPETVGTKKGPSLIWATYSNILFIASMEDDGKKLTCTAALQPKGEISTSIVLQVQRYIPKVVDPFENDTIHILEANVVPRISALTKSCVVIPCTFQSGDMPITHLRVLWYTNTGQYVFHTGQSNVIDNFKGRTRLLGNPDEQNCTLEIDKVQAHDNGPFCFHAEKGNDKYRFNHSCVFIIMKASPDKPVISALPEEMEPGKRFTINCSVTHTCSSHPPTITWNIPAGREVVSHVERSAGKWETTSTITFIPTGYEEEENLICRASFRGKKNQESSALLSVKRFEGLGMDTIGFGIILPLCLLLLLCIAAGLFIFRRKVQKTTTDELPPERSRRSIWSQISRRFDGTASWLNSPMETRSPERPPKPEKRRSIWSRFSRRGPLTSTDLTNSPVRPPKPEKRRSIWSRFSRRGPATSTDLTVHYKVNNISAMDSSAGYSKPRFPSPKREPKSYISGGGHLINYDEDDYTNTADFKMHQKI